MNRWKTNNGYEIIHILKGGCNAYLINHNSRNILVDTGTAKHFARLKENIDSVDLQRKNIDYLILTHTHYDHCQSAALIKEQEKCKIVISEGDKESVQNGFTPLPGGTLKFTKVISGAGKIIGRNKFGYRPFVADILIDENNDTLENGLDIRLIKTPGHSAGSISIIVDNEIAIVGDEMIGMFKNSVFPPFADDVKEMVRSWGRLLATGCRIFLPGHGRVIGRELLQKEYEKYSRRFPA